MDRKQLIDREARLGRIAGILGLASAALIVASLVAGLGADFLEVDSEEYALQLETFEQVRDEMLLRSLLTAAGLALFAYPVWFIFSAAAARSDTMRRSLIGLTVAGPIFLALAQICFFLAFDGSATDFIDNAPAGGDLNQAAEDAIGEQATLSIYLGLQIGGVLAAAIGTLYACLHAMRVGLLTRFTGTLGMALGVGYFFIGPTSYAVWSIVIAPVLAGWWPGGRPPAWDAGEAVPWLRPGEEPPEEPEELADPDEFADEDGDGLADGPKERPARRDNKKKRKRKQR